MPEGWLRWEEIDVALDSIRVALDDPKTLQPFAQRMRERAKQWIKDQGEGSWPPMADNTKKKYASQGHSEITKRGTIRAEKLRLIEKQLAALQKRTAKGYGDAERKKAANLQKRLAHLKAPRDKPQTLRATAAGLKEKARALQEQIEAKRRHKSPKVRAQAGKMQTRLEKLTARIGKAEGEAQRLSTYRTREIGETTAQRRGGQMMPNMGRTIRVRLVREGTRVLVLTLYSKSGTVGEAQDKGLGKGGKARPVLPPVRRNDVEYLAALIEGRCLDAWGSS